MKKENKMKQLNLPGFEEMDTEPSECWLAFLEWNKGPPTEEEQELWLGWRACWTYKESRGKKAFDELLEEMYNDYKQGKKYNNSETE